MVVGYWARTPERVAMLGSLPAAAFTVPVPTAGLPFRDMIENVPLKLQEPFGCWQNVPDKVKAKLSPCGSHELTANPGA